MNKQREQRGDAERKAEARLEGRELDHEPEEENNTYTLEYLVNKINKKEEEYNMNKITVYGLGPEKMGPREIEHSLESFQNEVEGYIEYSSMYTNDEGFDFCIVCDEEGKLKGKPLCLVINGATYVGECFITKCDPDGNEVSITDDDIDEIEDYILEHAEEE